MKHLLLLCFLLIAHSTVAAQHQVSQPNEPTGGTISKPKLPPKVNATTRNEWQRFAHDSSETAFYQPASVMHTDHGTITVWTKRVPENLEAARREQIAALIDSDPLKAKKYSTYVFQVNLMEVKCSTKEFRLLEFVDYGSDGDVLDHVKSSNGTWTSIVPDTFAAHLSAALCDPLGIDRYLRENPSTSGLSPDVDEMRKISEQSRIDAQSKPKRAKTKTP